MMVAGEGPSAPVARPSLALLLLAGLGRLSPLRRHCYRIVGQYIDLHPQEAVVLGRMAGLSTVLDLRETMERTIFLSGHVDAREIALIRWLLRGLDHPVIFDIGANVGNHSAGLRDMAGHIFAFEPNPPVHARLADMIARNGVTNISALQIALSDRQGVAQLRSIPGHSERAKLKEDDAGTDRLRQVDVTTGDAFVASRGIDRLDLMKVDVEGHEPAVLRGLRETLQRLRPIVVFERYKINEAHSRTAFSELMPGYRLIGTGKRRLPIGRLPGSRLEAFRDAAPYAMALAVPEERAESILGRHLPL